MSLRTSANRYAKALFDVAVQERADLAQIDTELSTLSEVMREHHSLLQEATRHGVPDEARMAVVSAVADKLGAGPQLRKLLLLLARSHKLAIVPDMAVAFRERLDAHLKVARAEVTSAAPLSPEASAALKANLEQITGKRVEMNFSVDAGLIGGVVARIGSTVYDGSVKTQLKKMREALTA